MAVDRVSALEAHLLAATGMLSAASILLILVFVDDLRLFAAAILPAMAANGTPVVTVKPLVRRGVRTHPIDLGRSLGGRRVLGDNKTFEGFLAGVLGGMVVGALLGAGLGLGALAGAKLGAVAGLGAMLGDLAGSFVKRRIGLGSGEPAILLDQLDFYVGAVALLLAYGVPLEPYGLLSAGLLVFGLHVFTNCLAYRAGLKEMCP